MSAARPVAGLPMYDWPELRPAHDALWAAIAEELAARGISAPGALDRRLDEDGLWQAPGLVLAQTCGLPLVVGRRGAAAVVARADYGLPLASEGRYCAVVVAHRRTARGRGPAALRALRGVRLAVNDWGSFSGHVALRAHLAALDAARGAEPDGRPFFAAAIITGSHRASARLVASGGAELAALDAVAWGMLARHEPEVAAALSPIALTLPAPALPFITGPALAARREEIRAALAAAVDRTRPARPEPGLPRGILSTDRADYRPVAAALALAATVALAPEAPELAATPGALSST